MNPTAADLLEALASAVVDADADDPSTLEDLARALEAARAGGVGGALADEAAELAADLAKPDVAADALRRVGELVAEAQGAKPATAALTGAASAQRDAETIELVGDFLEEGSEGLTRADELLLAIEKGGPDTDKTHALFRVFHTIKGVAGFLELGQIVAVAHTAETLLNQVREGRRTLQGTAFDVTFEATALLRTMLDRLRAAVDAGVALAHEPAADGLVTRIQAEIDRTPGDEAEAPAVAAPPPVPAAGDLPARRVGPLVPAGDAELAPEYVVKVAEPPAPEPAAPAVAAAPAATATSASPAPSAAPATSASPAAAAADPRGDSAGTGGSQLRETVKVDLERVDSMVEMIGELIIVESMVVHAPELQAVGSLKLRNYLNQLTKISRDLQNVAMRMRMVPVRGAFQKMARLVRDLARKTGKEIVLEHSGEDTEMDRSMVERIEDPLVHLVRNAVDHGIESVADRAAAGKPTRATLRLSAYHEGGSIVVELTDDGRGLQRDRILAKAREKGLVDPTHELTEQEVYNLVFLPGFSTAAKVTEISGRGVGMDVVKRNIEGMRGRVSVTSRPGHGTTFKMVLPLTLAIIDGMLVSCGKERYIVPSLAIVESLRPSADMIKVMAGRGEIINVRGEILPLLRLHRLLQMTGDDLAPTDGHVVVIEGLGRKVGLVVDDVLTQQQVVIKPLGSGIGDTDYLSGAAILSDGRVGLILNVDKLASLAMRAAGGRAREAAAPATEA